MSHHAEKYFGISSAQSNAKKNNCFSPGGGKNIPLRKGCGGGQKSVLGIAETVGDAKGDDAAVGLMPPPPASGCLTWGWFVPFFLAT